MREGANEASARLARVERIAREVAGPNAADVDLRARFPAEAIGALREERFLGAVVPSAFGGMGCDLVELGAMCEALAQHCASTAMVFAMHQIKVACYARHGVGSPFFERHMAEIAEKQLLVASVTSEVGVGGDLRSSVCAVEARGERFSLRKEATTISYGRHADELLLTARRSPDAAPGDQVLVCLRRGDYELANEGSWDTLGMRGTCSPGFVVTASAPTEQILPAPFADIASQTMVPYSHVLWSSVWLGIATAATSRARAFVRQQARSTPGRVPPTALRLAEAASALQSMRASVRGAAERFAAVTRGADGADELSSARIALELNNLKLAASEAAFDVVHRCLLICGIAGYRNDSKFALGRHLRDACSAALMIGNDRVAATNASLLLVLKDDG